ncbi:MAG: PAS domain S-box protein [Melioribacteraceae bacterium]|nr:PAS domain S-box protein [Melioribacteraceae bacterium]
MIRKIFIQPKSLLFIFFTVLILVSISVFNEQRQSRKEVLEILESQSKSLLEAMIVSSQEILFAGDEIEEEIRNRLLNNASLIKILLSENNLNNQILQKIAYSNNINRINVFDKNAKLKFSNIPDDDSDEMEQIAGDLLAPIFEGVQDTLIIGLRQSRLDNEFRYIVALAANNSDAIVLNLDADELLEFRKRIGFGILLNKLTENEQVIYTALQDTFGIMAASGNISELDPIANTEFLERIYDDATFDWRFYDFGEEEVYEAVHRFELDDETVGLFRIGLSLEPLNQVYSRITNRVIIFGILLLALGTFLLTLVFTRQNFNLLKKQYSYIEDFASKLVSNANDVIIVLNAQKQIVEINPAAENYFRVSGEKIRFKNLSNLLPSMDIDEIINSDSKVVDLSVSVENEIRNLFVSISEFKDSQEELRYVLIMRDVTKLKELEEQITRGKQLTAMGNLASGVAHEIRNPLNSISTIVQQLKKDFEPKEDKEDYEKFVDVVYKEVQRINKTIESFLKLAKPKPVQRSKFNLAKFFNELFMQFEKEMKNKSIELKIENEYDDFVNWDYDQMRQVMINLIKNASDAIEGSGKINITCKKVDDKILLTVNDDGKGISPDKLDKIFNLYFTTKAEGTGIGLGIVQRIINEHGGIIKVSSQENIGTKFIIELNID